MLCRWCSEEALLRLPSRCYKCHAQTIDFATCNKCRRKSKLANVWVGGEYEGVAKTLIYKLKFERAKAAARTVAELMDEFLPYFPADIIVSHVPTASRRRRQRGYDQSELIASRLAKTRSLRHVGLLGRIGQSRQVGADKKTRQEQIENMFYAINPRRISGKSILLIDDIVTSGASLEAAALALKQNGARKIFAATFAQKL